MCITSATFDFFYYFLNITNIKHQKLKNKASKINSSYNEYILHLKVPFLLHFWWFLGPQKWVPFWPKLMALAEVRNNYGTLKDVPRVKELERAGYPALQPWFFYVVKYQKLRSNIKIQWFERFQNKNQRLALQQHPIWVLQNNL